MYEHTTYLDNFWLFLFFFPVKTTASAADQLNEITINTFKCTFVFFSTICQLRRDVMGGSKILKWLLSL